MRKNPSPDAPPKPKARRSPRPGFRLWAHDRGLLSEFPVLCGVDEAGRGPLAGNVVAACVILDLDRAPLADLNDSKQVDVDGREALFAEITATARAWGVGEGTPEEIDRHNILQATFLAMQRALRDMESRAGGVVGTAGSGAAICFNLLLVDGNQRVPDLRCNQRCLVQGDGRSASIAAASILAKVTRDRQMLELHGLHPEYGFDSHKGYGTAAHREAIARYGLTPFHRRSFCLNEVVQESLFGE
ncbi:MAG TPA: ribonuclease HII [Fibrobacteria bacterium]|nr:ribonuclease HII [Fibrobacteria bacterium]